MNDKTIKISDTIKTLGVPANVKGYRYLRCAIELVMSDISYIDAVTTILYPRVAKKFNTTPSRVERAIRHAIQSGWLRGNVSEQKKIFSYTVDANKGVPTNSEFISMVADYIEIYTGE